MSLFGYNIIKDKDLIDSIKQQKDLERVYYILKLKSNIIDGERCSPQTIITPKEAREFGLKGTCLLSAVLALYKKILENESI